MRKIILHASQLSVALVSLGLVTLSFQTGSAEAGSAAMSRYIKTALPNQQKEVFTMLNPVQKKKVEKVIDQNAAESQQPKPPAPAVVMEKINEDEIPKIAITELRDSKITDKTTGVSEYATLKLTNGKVVAIMDDNGWEPVTVTGVKTVSSTKTGAIYSYTRGKLKRRYKVRYKIGRLSFKTCMKNKSCRKKYRSLAKSMKKARYIPTRLRAKICMKNRKCRNKVTRLLNKYRKKHCYLPTRGKKLCKVKR